MTPQTSGVRPGQILLYAMLTSLTALSIDAILPALHLVEIELGEAPPLSTHHIVSLFVFGMAFGELLLGPISDAIGRKTALLGGLLVYAAGTVLAMLASSIEMVVLGRIVQGIGVAGPKIATRAMIRDQFAGDAMARVMSFMFTLFILVPMIAPALGQAVAHFGGWRSIFAVFLAMAGLLGVWLILRQPETLAPERRIPFRPGLLARNALNILKSRRVLFLIIATGFVFGSQLVFLSTAADLFRDAYGVRATFPIYFAILAGGIGLASFVNAQLVQRFGMDRMARSALLGLTLIGALMLLASLVFEGRPAFVLFMALGFCAFFCIGILFGNLNAMAMRTLGQVAGIGASLIASGSSLVATGFALAVGAFYDQTILHLAAGFFFGGAGALLLVWLALKDNASDIEAKR